MFKMASFGFNTFMEAFSKVADDGRARSTVISSQAQGVPKIPGILFRTFFGVLFAIYCKFCLFG